MSRHRSKLVQAAIAMVLLAMSAALWPSLGVSATYASAIPALATSTAAACPNPGNNACVSNTPTVGLTLNGNDQSPTYTLTFTLNSTSSSWHVTITSTRFTSGSHTLPSNASSVTSVTVVPTCSGSTCPVNSITPTVVVPVPPTPPATFYDNTGGGSHGQGTFNIQATIQVAVPANSYVGTYTCTITIAFASGP